MSKQPEIIVPAMFTIPGACAYSGYSRSYVYLEVKAGRLDMRKAGRRSLITRASLDANIAALPSASKVRP